MTAFTPTQMILTTDNDADLTFLRRETRSFGQAGLYWTLMVLKS